MLKRVRVMQSINRLHSISKQLVSGKKKLERTSIDNLFFIAEVMK